VSHPRVVLVVAALSCVTALLGACSHDIGDSCKTSADCDPNGTRACDLSQPGGYCTMVGCDEKSCPSGSACIRYFPEALLSSARMCIPECEDLPPACPGGGVDCLGPDGGALPDAGRAGCPNGGATNDCAADELCLDSGLCVKRSYETRACAKTCGSLDDCRGGQYTCRPASASGMMLLGASASADAKVCAPL
jgi:hypothetical protein